MADNRKGEDCMIVSGSDGSGLKTSVRRLRRLSNISLKANDGSEMTLRQSTDVEGQDVAQEVTRIARSAESQT